MFFVGCTTRMPAPHSVRHESAIKILVKAGEFAKAVYNAS